MQEIESVKKITIFCIYKKEIQIQVTILFHHVKIFIFYSEKLFCSVFSYILVQRYDTYFSVEFGNKKCFDI